jgi:hypothetical protein
VRQPPYSLDMALCKYKLKKALRGKKFDDVELMEENAVEQLLSVLKIEFKGRFQQEWGNNFVYAEGAYFEGSNMSQFSDSDLILYDKTS